jgi:hypothetical protein
MSAWRKIFLTLVIAALCAGGVVGTGSAQNAGISPHPVNRKALLENEVKDLVLLMDTDKNGKISKQEFMKFMEEEFDRLDTDKSGELDVNELKRSQFRPSARVGK